MKLPISSLQFRLYVWYFGSLILLSVYFYIIVHILMLPHSTHIFLLLLALMAMTGFLVIYRITQAINSLTKQIRTVTSNELNKRIQYVNGGEELNILADSFNHVLNNVDNAFRREKQFISDLAHELKTPLAIQQTSFEVVLSKPRSVDEYKKIIKQALIENKRLSNTLQHVLELAWTESGEGVHTMQPISLSDLIEEIADISQKLVQKKHLKLRINIAKHIVVSAKRDKLAQAILHIIENAVNYTKEGSISMRLFENNNAAVVEIQDTGVGIEQDEIQHIFQRFYRGERTKNVQGTGLGLAIAHSIIRLHGGTLRLLNSSTSGSTFEIRLPYSS